MSAGGGIAMVSFSLSKGLTIGEIGRATGVSVQNLLNLDKRPPEEVLPRLWAYLGERFPSEPLTLEMARAAPFSFFGGLAEGAQFAEDLRSAVQFFARNPAMVAGQLSLDFEETSYGASLSFRHPWDDIDGGRSAELGAALATRMFTEFLGIDGAVLGATMAHGPLSDQQHYAEFFGGPVEFNAQETSVIFDPCKLDAGIEHSNAELFHYVKTHFSTVQKRVLAPHGNAKLLLLQTAAMESVVLGVSTAAGIAAGANMSLRTAQRIAADHDTTLQQLVADALATRAKEFLADDKLDIASISLLLGYSDERAFRRAFRSWTGLTPSDYRRNLSKGNLN